MTQTKIKIYPLLCLILILLFTTFSFANLKDSLFAYPNPFNPPGQLVRFHYHLSVTGLLSIDIFDSRGVHIREVIKQVSKAASVHKGEESWDGKNDKGEFVPAGIYTARFDMTYSGGTTERATVLIGLVR